MPQKTKCPSLGAILIPAHNIEFFTEDGKLRARITDYSKQTYELKVSCKYLRDIFEKDKDIKITIPKNAVETYDAPHHKREEYNEIAFKLMAQAGINLVENLD